VTPDIWDEEEFLQEYQEPVPEPVWRVNPHLAYTQGPAGQTITDWKAFGGNATPEQLIPHCSVEDRRDNRDPEEVYKALIASRNGGGTQIGGQMDLGF
jgi:hypothetical protein